MSKYMPFWMVYGEGQRAPTFKHETPGSARQEAMRLASEHPGITFFVLASTGAARKVEVEFIEIDTSFDGVPF